MGRHSAALMTRRTRRITTNSLTVLLVTTVASIAIYTGVSALASAKNAEVPPPTMVSTFHQAQPQYAQTQQSGYPPAAYAQSSPGPSESGTLRRCPATGCTASTCHAETGEPIPRY